MSADDATRLLDLAKKRFGSLGGISAAEEKLIRAAAAGEVADYRMRVAGSDDPAKADAWGAERRLRAEIIAWLCTDRQAVQLISHRGIRLAGARVVGKLDISYARISFPLWLDNSSFTDAIWLTAAHLPELSLEGTHTPGVQGDRLEIKGSLFLRWGFRSEGTVRLHVASIGGDLDCKSSEFISPGGVALSANRVRVEGTAFLCDGLRAHGLVSLEAATIGCQLQWWGVRDRDKTELDLRSAKAGSLWDEEASWPQPQRLFLHGFEYAGIYAEAPNEAAKRLDWLRRQPQGQGQFFPQPYEQLAKVLREQGHEEDAREVLIGKNKDRARFARMGPLARFGHWVLGKTVVYGYRPWRAFYLSLLVVALGAIAFSAAHRGGLMRPIVERGGGVERFSAVMYSIDVFLPIVDFCQENAWRPDAMTLMGRLVRWYLWVHITLGWVLTAAWVAGLSGLVKR